MPPLVTIPIPGGYTTGATYTICWANAHANHPPKNVTHWRVTIGTYEGLNDKYDSGLLPPTTLYHTCNMPADNRYYFTQVEWTGGSPGISKGNYFRSLP